MPQIQSELISQAIAANTPTVMNLPSTAGGFMLCLSDSAPASLRILQEISTAATPTTTEMESAPGKALPGVPFQSNFSIFNGSTEVWVYTTVAQTIYFQSVTL